jgi:hypothetical protein
MQRPAPRQPARPHQRRGQHAEDQRPHHQLRGLILDRDGLRGAPRGAHGIRAAGHRLGENKLLRYSDLRG